MKLLHTFEFTNVTVFVGDSIVGGSITDSIGVFALTIPERADHLHVSFMGEGFRAPRIDKNNDGSRL